MLPKPVVHLPHLPHLTLPQRPRWPFVVVLAVIAGTSLLRLVVLLAEGAYLTLAFFLALAGSAWHPPLAHTAPPAPPHWATWWHPAHGPARIVWLQQPAQSTLAAVTTLLSLGLLLALGIVLWQRVQAGLMRQAQRPSTACGSAHLATVADLGAYALEPVNDLVGMWQQTRTVIAAWRGKPAPPPLTNYVVGREVGTQVLIGLTRPQLERHVLAVATTGSGKTATQIIPAHLREDGQHPFFSVSLKGDVYAETAGAVAQRQRVWHLNLVDVTQTHGYDPLDAITSYDAAQAFADAWIANTGATEAEGHFWDREASKLLTMLTWHLRVRDPDATFLRLIDLVHVPYETHKALLTTSPDPIVRLMAGKAFDAWDSDARVRGNVAGDVAARFVHYLGDDIRRALSQRDIHLREMVDEATPTGLYLSMSLAQLEQYRALFATLVTQILATWTAVAQARPQRRLAQGSLLYLDEFANLGHIPGFVNYLTLTRSLGIGMVLMIQNRAQLVTTYGPTAAQTISGGCRTHIVFSGCTPEDAALYSEQLDDMTILRRQAGEGTHEGGAQRRTSRTSGWAEAGRRLLRANEIQQLPRDLVLLIPERQPPLLVRTQPYDADPPLKALAALPPPVIVGPPAPPALVISAAPPPKPRTPRKSAGPAPAPSGTAAPKPPRKTVLPPP
ncbi:MAG: type IV secretory system conjugative DNA transfer family protein [Ktedonobacterales bacterium]|nr:type IV secretory system conjugative DNA transfer family protein [Ktedonobacterales bacterium]